MIGAIRRKMDPRQVIGVVFIGMRKAFDTLNQSVLSDNLSDMGVVGHEREWFTNYLRIQHGCRVSRHGV